MRKFNQVVAALAFGAGLAVSATAAQATTVILDEGVMDHARTVNIQGIGNVYAAPMQFDAVYGGQRTDLLAWCVDVYHTISAKDYSPNLQYTDTSTLSTDFNGHALDNGDVMKIGLLANYGQGVFDDVPVPPPAFTLKEPKRNQFPNGSAGTAAYNKAKADYKKAQSDYDKAKAAYNTAMSTRYTRLQAVQGAIWQVASDRNVSSSDRAFDKLVDDLSGAHMTDFFAGDYGNGDYGFTLITPVQQYGGKHNNTPLPLTQSFIFATGSPAAVPEPGTWALLIAGFGGAGAMLRRQRRLGAVA